MLVEEERLKENLAQQKNVVTILSYNEYFDAKHFQHLITPQLSTTKKDLDIIFSSQEAIGGYLKKQESSIDGEFQVLDIEKDFSYSFSLCFREGKYSLNNRTQPPLKIPMQGLYESYFNKTEEQIARFESFIEINAWHGKSFGSMVWEYLCKYENGAGDYDELIASFNSEEWADITIAKLATFKKSILLFAKIDETKPYKVVGDLGSIFSTQYAPMAKMAKQHGAEYLYEQQHTFYHKHPSIFFELYCYPKMVKIPIYDAKSSTNEYCIPKQLQVVNVGDFSFYHENQQLKIPYLSEKKGQIVSLEMFLDRNQNVFVKIDDKIHLLHE